MGKRAFTHEQKDAVDAIASGKDVCLAGESASGKTTVLRHAVKTLPKDRRVIVAAPTAAAAAAVGG